MLQGIRCRPQRVDKVVGRDKRNRPIKVPEFHLFIEKLGYGQHTDKRWYVKPPGEISFPLEPAENPVTEHEDGTITVAGEPFETRFGVFRLVRGWWLLPEEEVPTFDEAAPTEPEPQPAAEPAAAESAPTP